MDPRPAGGPTGPGLDREDQFLELFLGHERRLRGFIFGLVPNWSDADDVFQETFAVIWRRLDEFQPGTDFAAWALSIARYQVLNYRRREKTHHLVFSDRAFEALADQLTAADDRGDARRDALEACLAKLGPQDREVLRLRYQQGATTQAVADALGRPAKAVYKTLNRLHDQLLHCVRQTLPRKAFG